MSGHAELKRPTEELGAWGEQTRRLYGEHGIGERVGYGGAPAVLLIDMARAFCDAAYRVGCDQTPAVEAVAQVLAAARERGVPVLYTITAYEADGRGGGWFVRKIPAPLELRLDDRAVTEIDPRLAPVEGSSCSRRSTRRPSSRQASRRCS